MQPISHVGGLRAAGHNVKPLVEGAIADGGGLLAWLPAGCRAFLRPEGAQAPHRRPLRLRPRPRRNRRTLVRLDDAGAGTLSEGYVTWIVYGRIKGRQYFGAKELTVEPRARCTVKDSGAYGLITVQGIGRINKLALDCPKLIRFGELTEDEVFCTESAPATA